MIKNAIDFVNEGLLTVIETAIKTIDFNSGILAEPLIRDDEDSFFIARYRIARPEVGKIGKAKPEANQSENVCKVIVIPEADLNFNREATDESVVIVLVK